MPRQYEIEGAFRAAVKIEQLDGAPSPQRILLNSLRRSTGNGR